MNSDELSRLESRALALGHLLHSEATQAQPDRFQSEGSARLLRRLDYGPALPRPQYTPRFAVLLAALALGSALLLVLFWPRNNSALAFRVEGSARVDGARIAAVPSAPSRLRFSEGSAIELEPECQLEVEGTTSAGATLRLMRGAATAQIVHRADTQWLLLAGPFWIRVVGTSFLTRWDPVPGTLTVKLFAGEVEVGGGSLVTGVRLRPGQRFDAVNGSTEWSVRPLLPAASASVTPPGAASIVPRPLAEVPSVQVEGPIAPQPSTAAAVPGRGTVSFPSPPTHRMPLAPGVNQDWPAAVARGEFVQVVAAAEARGISRCLSSSSPKDLQALADAARYSGKLELAERTLLALHARSPGASPMTAYLLGSLNEAKGRPAVALQWYQRCLGSAGAQGIVGEARAGQLRTLLASQGAKAARKLAQEYLRDYPQGVGASTARRILETE